MWSSGCETDNHQILMPHVWRGVVVVVTAAILTVTVTAAFGAIDWRQLMRRISLPRRDDGAIEGRVTIQRSIDDVFKFYRGFRNLSRLLGDVTPIEPLGRATYRWTIQGLLGIRSEVEGEND